MPRTAVGGGIYIQLGANTVPLENALKDAQTKISKFVADAGKSSKDIFQSMNVGSIMENVTKDFARLRVAVRGMGADLGQYQAQFREIGKEIGLSGKELSVFSNTMQSAFRQQAKNDVVASLRAIQRQTGLSDQEVRNLARSLGVADVEFSRAGRAAAGFCFSLGNILKLTGQGALVTTMAAPALDAIRQLTDVRELLNSMMRMDTLKVSYGSIFGGAEGGIAQLDYIYDLTQKLGLNFQSAAEGAKGFFAASKGTSLEKDANDIFESVSIAAQALHLSQEDVQGVFLAISQMVSKGKVSMEELRRQLGDRLPGAFQLAAKAMGMTTAELDKAVSSGNVMAEDLLPKLAHALRTQYAAAAEEASKSVQSAMNRLNTEWELFKAGILNSNAAAGALDGLRGAIQGLSSALRELSKYKDLLQSLLAGGAAAAGVALIGRYGAGVVALTGNVTKLMAALRGMGALLLTPWGMAATAIGATAAALYYLSQKADAAEQAQQALNAAQEKSREINKALADQTTATAAQLERQAKMADATYENLVQKMEALVNSIAHMGFQEERDAWGASIDEPLGKLGEFEQKFNELAATAATTGDFEAFKEGLRLLALDAENSGKMTDALRAQIEKAQEIAALGIKLNVEINGFEDAISKLAQLNYWRQIMGQNAPPMKYTDWREDRDAANQDFLKTLTGPYGKTTSGKREGLLADRKKWTGIRAGLAARGLSPDQLARSEKEIDAIIGKIDDDLKNLDKKSGGGTGKIDNARERIQKLREEIAALNGEASKQSNSLEQKLREIERSGAAAKMSAAEIAQLKTEYREAFQAGTLRDFGKEMAKLTNDTAALRAIEVADTVRDWEQRFRAAGLSAEESAANIAKLKDALGKQQQYKDLQTAARFFEEIAALSGNYGMALQAQNQLIEYQAELYRTQLPEALKPYIEQWERLQKLEKARDPFSGMVRGLQKYGEEATNLAKGMENAVTTAFSGMEDAFVQFVTTGKLSFTDLANSIIADLARIAIRAAITGPLAQGIGNMLGSFFGGGFSYSPAQTATMNANGIFSSGFGLTGVHGHAKGGAYSGGTISDYANSIISTPTYFNLGTRINAFARGAGVMGEAGAEAIMPLRRGANGRLGVEMYRDDAGEQSGGAVTVNIINSTGEQVSQQTRTDNYGNKTIDVMIGDAAAKQAAKPGSAMNRAIRGITGVQQPVIRR